MRHPVGPECVRFVPRVPEEVLLPERLKAVPYRQPPWSERYPKLVSILDDDPGVPKGNVLRHNVVVRARDFPLADEVRRLRDEAALAELADEPNEAVAEESDEGLSVEEDEAPVAEPADIHEAVAETDDEVSKLEQPEPLDQAVQEVQEKPWALDSLFATLRSEPSEATPMAAPEYPQESAADAAPRPDPAADANVRKSASVPDEDAIADRDRLLLPITNRVLRSVKRQLTEAQNIALEDVRVNETWNPKSVDLAERVRGDLLVLVQESYAAGQSAAGSILATSTPH